MAGDTIDVYASYDGHQNFLKNWAGDNLAAPPASPVPGQFYYDTTLNVQRVWNGSAWVASTTQKFATNIGDGLALSYVVAHNLGTRDVNVTVYNNAAPWQEPVCSVFHTSANTVTIGFSLPVLLNSVRVVVTA